jgi:hypothetical protein
MDRIRAWFGGGSSASDDQSTMSAPEPASMPDQPDMSAGGTAPAPAPPPPVAEPPATTDPGAEEDRPA